MCGLLLHTTGDAHRPDGLCQREKHKTPNSIAPAATPLERPGKPKTAGRAASRITPIAGRGAHPGGVVGEGPAAQNAERAIATTDPGATIHRRTLIVVMPAILNPLLDITTHIIQTKLVRYELLGAHNLSGLVAHDLSGSHASLRREVYEPDRTATGDQTDAF